jgi:hypothetical protein
LCESEREKEYCRERYGKCSGKVAAIPSGNYTELKNLTICKPVFVLKNHVFWFIAPSGWVISCRLSKEGKAIIFRFKNLLITTKMTAVRSFETSLANYATTWSNNPEDLVPQ